MADLPGGGYGGDMSDAVIASPPASASSRPVVSARHSVKVVQSCTVERPAAELYAFWRNVMNFHGLLRYPVSITPVSNCETRWVVTGPPGFNPIEWFAVIIADQPNESIAWRSRDGADVPNAGSVHFRPAPEGEGTQVTVKLRYEPPAGRMGAWLAKVLGRDPDQQVGSALRRFKILMETGEVPDPELPLAGRGTSPS